MSSRLFHAIVGVGVSVGTTACSGLVDEPGPSPVADARDASIARDVWQDTDAKADAASDARVIFDAFCDAPWPTTKGGGRPEQRPACTNPEGRCVVVDAGWGGGQPSCIEVTGQQAPPYACNGREGWDQCFEGQWRCPTGWLRPTECQCLGTPGPGYKCTMSGWQKVDGGP